MKKMGAAVGLLLMLLVLCLASAGADGLVRDLNVSEIRAASAVAAWNCTYKDEQEYTLSYHVEGIDRDTVKITTNTVYRLKYLAPATTYTLTVKTETGGAQSVTFTTPYAVDFTRYDYQLLDTGLYQTTVGKKDYATLTSLDSKTLPGLVYDYDFHFMFQFSLAETDADKVIDCVLLLRLPNGDLYYVDKEYWFDPDSKTYTEYLSLTDTLKAIMADYDGFPTGEYTISVYLKGEFAGELAFEME